MSTIKDELSKELAAIKARNEQIKGLRELADWLEDNPSVVIDEYDTIGVQRFGESKDEAVTVAHCAPKMDKRFCDSLFEATVMFSGGVRYELNVNRALVCERRVVGTKHVEEHVIKAHDEDIVEWDCNPILGS